MVILVAHVVQMVKLQSGTLAQSLSWVSSLNTAQITKPIAKKSSAVHYSAMNAHKTLSSRDHLANGGL